MALAYVPENKVIDCFELLLNSEFYEKLQTSLTEFNDYFEDTSIDQTGAIIAEPQYLVLMFRILLQISPKIYSAH